MLLGLFIIKIVTFKRVLLTLLTVSQFSYLYKSLFLLNIFKTIFGSSEKLWL